MVALKSNNIKIVSANKCRCNGWKSLLDQRSEKDMNALLLRYSELKWMKSYLPTELQWVRLFEGHSSFTKFGSEPCYWDAGDKTFCRLMVQGWLERRTRRTPNFAWGCTIGHFNQAEIGFGRREQDLSGDGTNAWEPFIWERIPTVESTVR